MKRLSPLFFILPAALALSAGCSPDKSNGDGESGRALKVIWDYYQIDGEPAADNPLTGDKTPDIYNKINFLRYRADSGDRPPRDVSAVLVLLPGFGVGAAYLAYMAQSMVELSHGEFEAWVVDHRHNLAEDQTGLLAAWENDDPMIAFDYYFNGSSIDGKKFGGVLDANGPDSGMISEWSLELTLSDLRRVIELVPEQTHATNVFLGGHSRGVAYLKAFAAHRFDDGRYGCEDLAGLILADGDSLYDHTMTEASYQAELKNIRSGLSPRYAAYGVFGPNVYIATNILALSVMDRLSALGDPRFGPDGVLGVYGALDALLKMFLRGADITMTNEALFGFFSDKESSPIALLRGGMGKLDGPVASDDLGVYPTDEDHLYTWLKYNEVTPPEYVDISDVANSVMVGPSNFADYYYSARHQLDLEAADILETEDNWRDKYFSFSNSRVDVPVLLVGSRVVAERIEQLEFYRDQLPPVRGQSLPRDQFGFEIMLMPDWEHLDPIFAKADSNPFFARLLDWTREFSDGRTQIPALSEKIIYRGP